MTTSPPFVLQDRENGAIFISGNRRLRVQFLTPSVTRITYTEDAPFQDLPSRIVVAPRVSIDFDVEERPLSYLLRTAEMQVELTRSNGRLRYLRADGSLLMQEPERGGKWLQPRAVMRHLYDMSAPVHEAQSVDGARAEAAPSTTVHDRDAFEAKLEFVFEDGEALFGLGSHEEGYANLRGRSRELYQQNMKAVVPHLVSSRGYGVLLDCCSLMTFHDDALGSYWWADCVAELDFYVIAGSDYQNVLRGYRWLTGEVPLPPRWAFGFVQSKERYVNAEELLEVVQKYRRRNVPLDVIVLDWKSWPNGKGWGQKSLDPQRFPDPEALTQQLHAMGARLMVSIWPIMTGQCNDQQELLQAGMMLGNRSTYDAFQPEARKLYWQQAERGLFSHGVDAWWCDCTEPFEADWAGAIKPEPHNRLTLNTSEAKRYLDAAEINAYSLLHSQGIYEGQRRTTDDKRVLNLTRSAYAGQSRYGTFTWNGDISATWQTLRRSVAEGMNFCATGEPYWTVDAGGFFLDSRPDLWFWRGDYPAGTRGLTAPDALLPDPDDTGCTDLGFRELYTRWLQYAAFLPMCRSHGTDASREIWRFGEEGSPFYEAIAACLRLRSRLVPYIYAIAASITRWKECGPAWMVAPLALIFPEDSATHNIADQYFFGPSMMVCPVTEAMFYGCNSKPLQKVSQSRHVYLPAGRRWYDFHTDAGYDGGQGIEAEAPLQHIPVFCPAGTIVLLGEVMQYSDERPASEWELRIYTGADAFFTIYEDAGDGYAYERGECARILCVWEERHRKLTLHARRGSFTGMVRERDVRVLFFGIGHCHERIVRYTGETLVIVPNIQTEER